MNIIISILLGFILSLIMGAILIPFFRKNNTSQNVSKHLNERHLKKQGTPTMGGLIFIMPTIIIILLFIIFEKIKINSNLLLIIFVFISYAIIGFIDDYKKVIKHNNKGLSIITKFLLQIIISIIFFTIFLISGNSTEITIFNFTIDLKFLYGLFILFLLTGTSNAVNITDGLDGLAGGLCIISLLTFIFLSISKWYIIGNEMIAIFIAVLCGSLLGFLYYNFYPAKIFMGDLGSLPLGATLATIAIILKCEFALIFIGVIYIIETLSSLIQIISIRIFNKKIFYKSPLHHHFEEIGLCETDIIKLFYSIAIIFSIIALIIYM